MSLSSAPDYSGLRNRKVVVLHSGGLDSTTALYAARRFASEVRAISFFYGQRHRRELQLAREIQKDLQIVGQAIDLSVPFGAIAEVSKSSLISDNPVPSGHYAQENMVQTIVPNRNMIMISLAVGLANALEYDAVVIAAHAGDHFIYPDCRPDFISAVSRSAFLATDGMTVVVSPFIFSSKTDIARAAFSLGVPIEKTYSCYNGGEKHCGTCGTCTERIEALRDAGVPDPTEYINRAEGVRILEAWHP